MKTLLLVIFYLFNNNDTNNIKYCSLDGVVLTISSTTEKNQIKISLINQTDSNVYFPSIYHHHSTFTNVETQKKGTELFLGHSSLAFGAHLQNSDKITINLIEPKDTLTFLYSGIDINSINRVLLDFSKRVNSSERQILINQISYAKQAQFYETGLIW